MTRIRIPGGVCTPQQWLAVDRFCTNYANGALKLTTARRSNFTETSRKISRQPSGRSMTR
ncbi:MAG: hypothetical protein Ct9H300mP7_5370 [Verrucomicrobiota bacterium]|nr:MAG: hypothetical protein Ct9H300mP7_5370 [Verrucomicrobiota bacterium]